MDFKGARGTALCTKQVSIDDLYRRIGWGRYQLTMYSYCGLIFCSEGVEITLISWLTEELGKPDSPWQVSKDHLFLVGFVVFVGMLLGASVMGPLADRYGRKLVVITSNVCILVFGVLTAFAPNFRVLVVVRAFVGFFIGAAPISVDLLQETMDPDHIASSSLSMGYFWSAGVLFINAVACFVIGSSQALSFPLLGIDSAEPWRVMCLFAAMPYLIVAAGSFFVEESPKWMVDVGRVEDAWEAMQRMAAMNNVSLSRGLCLTAGRGAGLGHSSCCELLNAKYATRTVVLFVVWVISIGSYYGVTLASPLLFQNDGGSENYGALIFGVLGEILGTFLAIRAVGVVGMAKALCCALLYTGCFTLLLQLEGSIPTESLACLDFGARTGLSATGNLIYLVTPLAYPARIRATAHSLHFIGGRLGSMASVLPLSLRTLLLLCGSSTFVASSMVWSIRDVLTGDSVAPVKMGRDACISARTALEQGYSSC